MESVLAIGIIQYIAFCFKNLSLWLSQMDHLSCVVDSGLQKLIAAIVNV